MFLVSDAPEGTSKNSEDKNIKPEDNPQEANQEVFVDRIQHLKKIQQFYEKYPQGPNDIVTGLLGLYNNLCIREESLKILYEELQGHVE